MLLDGMSYEMSGKQLCWQVYLS